MPLISITAIAVKIEDDWFSTESPGIALRLEERPGTVTAFRVVFRNRSDHAIRLGGFRLTLTALRDVPGERIRLYREGWTMASAAGTVRKGECDFEVDPDYLKFAVSTPTAYDSTHADHFTAEQVVVLNDRETNQSVLAGFISSADQFSRFKIELDEHGVKRFEAFSHADGIVVSSGVEVVSEELVFLEGHDGYGLLEQFAALWGKRMGSLSWHEIPSGWCSWYYYFEKVTQADILENVNYLRRHQQDFPVTYIQLDDGYQAALGDWLLCNDHFPDGLQSLAAKVIEAGFKPGLWLAPFMVEERSTLFSKHPDWMVHTPDGAVLWASNWRGSRVAVLDGTHPGAQAYLLEVFSTLVRWGFDYVKLDFLVYACCGSGGCYYDPTATRAQALRRGMQVIRQAMGDRFILGCTTPLGPVVGLVNGERIGTDITPYWQPDRKFYKEAPTVPNVCRNVINRAYMNGRLWISDPDTHIARADNNKLTENEVVLWTFALYLTGGMLLFSDRFETLTPERAALSKLLLSAPGMRQVRPVDFFEREYPAIWLSRNLETGEVLLGLFNFEDTPRELRVDQHFVETVAIQSLSDFTTGEVFEIPSSELTVTVRAHSCRVLCVKE